MKRIVPFLVLFTLVFFIHSPTVHADAPGTANGSACDVNGPGSGGGQVYNGTCLPLGSYPSQSAGSINTNTIKPYIDNIVSLINTVFVPLLFAVAFIYFIYGIFKYFILGATNESEKGEGRKFLLWSLIGFVVILSVWGLVSVVLNTFGLTAGGTAGTNGLTPPTL